MSNNESFENCDYCREPLPKAGPGGMIADATGRRWFFCNRNCRGQWKAAREVTATPEKALRSITPKLTLGKPKPLSQAAIRRANRPSETSISTAIGKHLSDLGLWNTRTQSGAIKTASGHIMKLCRAGTPDRIFAAGLHVWIEVKRPGEVPSPDQVAAIAALKANGALVFVLDDATDLDFILDGLRNYQETINDINNDIRIIEADILHNLEMNRKARGK